MSSVEFMAPGISVIGDQIIPSSDLHIVKCELFLSDVVDQLNSTSGDDVLSINSAEK